MKRTLVLRGTAIAVVAMLAAAWTASIAGFDGLPQLPSPITLDGEEEPQAAVQPGRDLTPAAREKQRRTRSSANPAAAESSAADSASPTTAAAAPRAPQPGPRDSGPRTKKPDAGTSAPAPTKSSPKPQPKPDDNPPPKSDGNLIDDLVGVITGG